MTPSGINDKIYDAPPPPGTPSIHVLADSASFVEEVTPCWMCGRNCAVTAEGLRIDVHFGWMPTCNECIGKVEGYEDLAYMVEFSKE